MIVNGKFWQRELQAAIIKRKIRISILEKMGVGLQVMSEKALLKQAEQTLIRLKQ